MNDSQKLRVLLDINERAPHTRLNSALWQVRRKERAEELRKETDRPNPRGIVKFLRLVTGRA